MDKKTNNVRRVGKSYTHFFGRRIFSESVEAGGDVVSGPLGILEEGSTVGSVDVLRSVHHVLVRDLADRDGLIGLEN